MALWCAIGLWRGRQRLRALTPVSAQLRHEIEAMASRLGVRVPQLLDDPSIGSPYVWSFGRTCLVLPAAQLAAATPRGCAAVLAHELAHLRRGDHWLAHGELLLAAAFAIALLAADRSRLRRPCSPDGTRRAAFAVRDAVPPFQQWGTRAFTLPTLRTAYERVDYLTLPDHEDVGRSAFLARLGPLLDAHKHVDLFVLAHTNTCVEWVETLDANRRERLRLVYNTGCFDLAERKQWPRLGADANVGQVGLSASCVFHVLFLRGWVRGEPLEQLVPEGNAFTHRMLATIACFARLDVDRIAAHSHAEIGGNAQLSVDGDRR